MSATGTAPPTGRWTVRLLGAVEASDGQHVLSSFSTRAVAQLLARLALQPERDHPREGLIELLWPGVAMSAGRNRLRQALSTLKAQLEGRGAARQSVLEADRVSVRVVPGALDCDVRQLERLILSGQCDSARALCRGEFMPGHYDDWIIEERRRVDALHDQATTTAQSPAMPVVVPTGLPNYWTRAFGVDDLAQQLAGRVRAHRFVTVHGPGGSGKTRLAVTLAQRLAQAPMALSGDPPGIAFDRIAFVPLLDCLTADEMSSAIGLALQVNAGDDPLARVVSALTGRRALLVLDNCEQLGADAHEVFTRLLAESPGLHVLVTSRRLLDIEGEAAFALDGLPLPPPRAATAVAAASSAVALFIDRACAARSSFEPEPSELAAIVELVRQLGGMPLAIELAASRTRTHAPSELLKRLRSGPGTPMLDLLARRAMGDSAQWRHASMRHVVAWSWSQLDPAQAAMMRRASALASSARLETLACVAGVAPSVALQLIESLQDASLMQGSGEPANDQRHVLLQPVREYAAEQSAPEEARAARARLRDWLTTFGAAAAGHSPALVMPELPLVQSAIATAPADGAHNEAFRLVLALRSFWDAEPLPPGAIDALEACLPDLDDEAMRGDAHELLSYAHGLVGHIGPAIAHAELAVARAVDDRRRSLAHARWFHAAMYAGRDKSALRQAVLQAEALARRCGDDAALANALRFRSLFECNLNENFALAGDLSEQARLVWERLGSQQMANARLLERAIMWAWCGRNEDALALMPHIEQTAMELQDWIGLLHAARQHGRVLNRARRWEDAAQAFRRAIRIGWERHFSWGLAMALVHLPEALAMSGEAEKAARLRGFVEPNWFRSCGAMSLLEQRELKRAWRLIRQRAGGQRAEVLSAQGSGLGLAQAVALALNEDPAEDQSRSAGTGIGAPPPASGDSRSGAGLRSRTR